MQCSVSAEFHSAEVSIKFQAMKFYEKLVQA